MLTASQIIDDVFGGPAKVSAETGIPLTTVDAWRTVNFIPEWRQPSLLDLAHRLNKRLATTDFPTRDQRISRSKAAA